MPTLHKRVEKLTKISLLENAIHFKMTVQNDSDPARISLIGGRYLVFDYKQISRLRRDHNLCAILVGTTPQNPSQNVFQGVPLEIGPEEATGLVSIGAAYIVDELQAHLNALDSSDLTTRDAYLKDLASRRRQLSSALDQEDQRKKQEAQIYRKSGSKGSQILKTSDPGLELETKVDATTEDSKPPLTSLTTAHSFALISPLHDPSISHKPPVDPLWRWLQSNGYYMTPGLRFGSHYSVYPGDPLRYHAHFLANSYPWDKPVPLLDLVGNGRLGTAVKKGFLIGGQYLDENGQSKGPFRAFTIEWAAM